MYVIEEFAYKRYNRFIISSSKEPIDIKKLKELLPFVIRNSNQLSLDEFQDIKKILATEITRSKSGKTFSTFETVENSDRFELFMKQVLHYVTTYDLGLKGKDVFIDNPYFNEIVSELILIDSMTKEEFIERFLSDIKTTLQWTSNELDAIIEIINYFNLAVYINIDEIPSKELKISLMENFLIFPKNGEDFLRFVIYKVTGNTLLIKSERLLIKFNYLEDDIEYDIMKYINAYINQYGYIPLAEIFNRYKPIFLALKNKYTKSTINKISKLSKKYHKPKNISEYLQITQKIEENNLTLIEFSQIIGKMDLSYLIKLANALKYRILAQKKSHNGTLYFIRNGKIWVKENSIEGDYKIYYEILLKYITKKVENKIKDLKITFDIEKYKNYALPTSGKQFTGEIPNGTRIDAGNVVGVYWENLGKDKNHSVDLDLSLTDDGGKIGWDSVWSDDETIFSGDMTDAKDGAVESFYFKKFSNRIYSVKLNWFNTPEEDLVCPFTLFFGNIRSENEIPKTTIIDDLTFSTKMEITKKENAIQLGLITEGNFYFGHIILPNARTADIDLTIILNSVKIYLESKIRFEDLVEVGLTILQNDEDETIKDVELDKARILEIVS